MKNWLKYLLLFCVLIFSTGITMAQGPYEFTGSNTGQQTASANSGTIVYYTYLTVPLNQADFLKHLDYDISWRSQGFSSVCTNCPAQYGCVKINLYDNAGIFVQTLETIYEYNVNDGGSYYSYTGSLDFNVLILSGYEIRVVLQAQWPGWTSYVNSASITAVTGPSCETLIFENDFESSLNTTVWSTTSGVIPPLFSYNSTQVFGPFGNKTINLDLSGLPTHTYIRVEFNLYIFDSWDGNNANDEWKLKVDGVDRIYTDFDNHTWNSAPGNMQSYPHNVEFLNPVLTDAIQSGLPNRCWNSSNSGPLGSSTSLYFINNITQHTGTSLTIGLQGLGLQSLCDESWGIDNVKVYALGIVDGCTDPTACNYDPLATCDDASCIYDVSIVTATNVCTGVCDGEVSVAVSPITQGTNYTYTIDGGSVIPYSNNTNGLCAGNHSYEFFFDGISCGVETITINEYPAMILQTTVIDSTCDSSYAFVSATLDSSSTGNVSTLTYCASSAGSFDFSNIELVKLVGDGDSIVNNTINYSGSGPLGCDDYEDYTAQYTTLTPGQSYSVDVNTGTCSTPLPGVDSVKVFIDWNIDGDFDDTGEEVGASVSTSTTISFTVPNNGSYGATRMRVISQSQSLSSPTYPNIPVGACDVGTLSGAYNKPWYGVTEDYSIVISTPTAITNATYLWSPSGGTDSIANNLAVGTYTVTLTDANGCTASETAIVGATLPLSIIANSDQIICNGGTPSDLSSTASINGGSYLWTPNDFIDNTIQNPTFVSGLSLTNTTTYIVSFTNDDSTCTATDSVIITVNPLPVITSFTASPSPACVGDIITLQAITSIPVASYIFLQSTSGSFSPIANTTSGWQSISPPTTTLSINFSPIISTTDFKIKVKHYGGCPTILLTYNYISVIVNPIVSSPIYHN